MALQRLATKVLGGILDTLLPPRCLCCGGAVDR